MESFFSSVRRVLERLHWRAALRHARRRRSAERESSDILRWSHTHWRVLRYRQANPDGYQYSRFCELYQRWRRKQDVVLRQDHKAGEKLFVDWAGTTIPIHDPRGGPMLQTHLFVAVLGASSYTYAEATADEQLASWIGARVRAFEFYQGVPKLVVPDNARIDVPVIDDWAMAPLSESERRDFWEISEDRYQVRSTILTSQLPVSR